MENMTIQNKIGTKNNQLARLPLFKEYIDLRNLKIACPTDLIKLAYTLRNPSFETFRIIYMQDNKIVGYETVTSRIANICNIFNYKAGMLTKQDFSRACIEIVNRMFRLNANGYYIMHNYPSKEAKASNTDVKLTQHLAESVKGFLGHVIVNHDTYAFIDVQYNTPKIDNAIYIQSGLVLKKQEEYRNNPLLSISINGRNDIARLMYDIKNYNSYSLLVLTNGENYIKFVQELPNCTIYMNTKNMSNYIKELAKISGSCKAYFVTTSKNFFEYAVNLKHLGYITDCIAYNVADYKITILAQDNSKTTQNIFDTKNKEQIITTQKNTILDKDLFTPEMFQEYLLKQE